MEYICRVCGGKFYDRPSHERLTCSYKCCAKIRKDKMSGKNNPMKREEVRSKFIGRKLSDETLDKLRKSKTGVPCPEVTKRKLSEYWTNRKRPEFSGEKCHLWRGGLSSETVKTKGSMEYRRFVSQCLRRDRYTCRKCMVYAGKIHVHHLKNFSQHKKLQTVIANGITLCLGCHKSFHSQYGTQNNSIKQFQDFIGSNVIHKLS